LFMSLSSELTPVEDKGAFLGMVTAPSNVNVDYVQNAVKPYEDMLNNTPEKQYSQVIAGAPNTNQALVITTLKDWAERDRTQAEVMAGLTAQAATIPEVSISAFAFPEIETGEQGPPVVFVLSSPNSTQELATVAGSFLDKIRKSGNFVYSNLTLKYDVAQMRIKVDKEKAGTYGITMRQIASTLGYYLSEATITRVDIDGRAYKVISQVKRENRLSPESLKNYFISASNGESVPLSSLLEVTLEPQPYSLPRFSQLNSAEIQLVPSPTITTGDAIEWLQEAAKELPQGYSYDWKGEARQLVQEGNALATTFVLAVLIIIII
ncbi:MAG: efflux RND transporter permease subunit, partial [Enterococcus sp.]|nr:efflux RND transporter permease subunit [Enterococcus sp.]